MREEAAKTKHDLDNFDDKAGLDDRTLAASHNLTKFVAFAKPLLGGVAGEQMLGERHTAAVRDWHAHFETHYGRLNTQYAHYLLCHCQGDMNYVHRQYGGKATHATWPTQRPEHGGKYMKDRQLNLYGIATGQHKMSSLELIIRETLVRLYRFGGTIPKHGTYRCSRCLQYGHIRSNPACPKAAPNQPAGWAEGMEEALNTVGEAADGD